jgi:hypothetical protein
MGRGRHAEVPVLGCLARINDIGIDSNELRPVPCKQGSLMEPVKALWMFSNEVLLKQGSRVVFWIERSA